MNFDRKYFLEYKELQENTNIKKCYQQVILLFKYILKQLENDLLNYNFMNRIVENQMNFSYFQLTNDKLKKRGLKLQVIFIHDTCCFEVWISGYNRSIQVNFFNKIKDKDLPFKLAVDPKKNDYIAKITIDKDLAFNDEATIIHEIKMAIKKLEDYFLETTNFIS